MRVATPTVGTALWLSCAGRNGEEVSLLSGVSGETHVHY
jgi:hypothetical protein